MLERMRRSRGSPYQATHRTDASPAPGGAMVSKSSAFMQLAPWTILAPGAAIVLASGAFLLIGSGPRSALNPRDY